MGDERAMDAIAIVIFSISGVMMRALTGFVSLWVIVEHTDIDLSGFTMFVLLLVAHLWIISPFFGGD